MLPKMRHFCYIDAYKTSALSSVVEHRLDVTRAGGSIPSARTKQCMDKDLVSNLEQEARKSGVQKFVVGAVIKKGTAVLLLERATNDFLGGLVELPSGTVDEGEDLISALKREVEEETGLVIAEVGKYLGSFDYLSSSGKKTRQFNFLVETIQGDVVLNAAEHSSYRYADKADLMGLNISEETRKILALS
jgi:8-oxo-dGTP diphosphatase